MCDIFYYWVVEEACHNRIHRGVDIGRLHDKTQSAAMVRVVLHWGFQLLGEGDWLLALVVHHIPFRFALSHGRYVLCLLMNVNVELSVYELLNLWSLDLWLKTSMLRNRSKSFKNRFPFFELFTCKSHMVEMLKCWNGDEMESSRPFISIYWVRTFCRVVSEHSQALSKIDEDNVN